MARLGANGGADILRTATGASIVSAGTYFALYTSATDPSYNNAGVEASGGSPAYARIAAGTPSLSYSAGVETATYSAVTFNVPAGTYAYWGLFDAATGGNYLMGGTCTSQTFSGQGQYQLTVTITATA